VVKGYFPEDERLSGKACIFTGRVVLLKELFPDWVIESESIMVKEEIGRTNGNVTLSLSGSENTSYQTQLGRDIRARGCLGD
jgi:hypothetical protein